jgi:O-antigen/teichoic acid export membrane protein
MAVAGGFLFHELVFRIFVDTAYASASRWLPWMACAAGLFGLAQMQALKWMARLQPQRLQTSRIATSAVSIALVAAGAYIGGASGVVAAQVLSALIFLAWTFAIR